MPGRPDDEARQAAPASTVNPQNPQPDPQAAGGRAFFPSARVRSLSRVAVSVGLCAFFLILGFVSIRYSREQVAQDSAARDLPVQGSVLSPDELERIAERTRRLAELHQRLQAIEATPLPHAPPPPPPVSRPPRRPGGASSAVFSVPMSPKSGRGSGLSEISTLAAPDAPLQEGRQLVEALRRPTGSAAPPALLASTAPQGGPLLLEARPAHALQLRRGSFLPVVLSHPINTDVPGLIRGHLARDVRDATGHHLLLPQGAALVGEQRGSLASGDSRLLIDWQQVQLPDGRTLDLPEPQGTAAVDGSLGATGKVDRHLGSRFGTALLLGSLGATLQLSQPQQSATFGQGASAQQIAAGEVGARLNDLAERTLEERLNRPPTIRIPAGAQLNLLLLNDLVFPAEAGF